MAKSSFDRDQWRLEVEQREQQLAKENARKQNAQKKREKCLDRIFQIFLVILAFALGLIADNIGFFHW